MSSFALATQSRNSGILGPLISMTRDMSTMVKRVHLPPYPSKRRLRSLHQYARAAQPCALFFPKKVECLDLESKYRCGRTYAHHASHVTHYTACNDGNTRIVAILHGSMRNVFPPPPPRADELSQSASGICSPLESQAASCNPRQSVPDDVEVRQDVVCQPARESLGPPPARSLTGVHHDEV